MHRIFSQMKPHLAMDPQRRNLEGRSYRSAVDNGIWDVVLGAALPVMGAGIAWDRPQLGSLLAPLVVPLGFMATRWTTRRTGDVRFRPERVARSRRAGLVIPIAAGVVSIALLLSGTRLHDLIKAGVLLAVPVSIARFLFELRRLHAYAAAVLLAVLGVSVSGRRWEVALIATGLVIITIGSVMLVRFVRRYPGTSETDRD